MPRKMAAILWLEHFFGYATQASQAIFTFCKLTNPLGQTLWAHGFVEIQDIQGKKQDLFYSLLVYNAFVRGSLIEEHRQKAHSIAIFPRPQFRSFWYLRSRFNTGYWIHLEPVTRSWSLLRFHDTWPVRTSFVLRSVLKVDLVSTCARSTPAGSV